MNNNLKTAVQASLDAGKEILRVYSSDFEVEIKSDNSPLTIADKSANQIIEKYLKTTGIPIISEESEIPDYSIRKNWKQYWLVDPLDGTKEFIKRNGEFTVNIALIENGIPTIGVIYLPVDAIIYYTEGTRSGAKKFSIPNNKIGTEEILKSAKKIYAAPISKTVKILASRSHLNKLTNDFINDMKQKQPVEIINKGSSLKFCLLAEGVANVYPRFGPTMEWDTAAGDAICRAVGISVIDQNTQQELRYNKSSLVNSDFIVQRL